MKIQNYVQMMINRMNNNKFFFVMGANVTRVFKWYMKINRYFRRSPDRWIQGGNKSVNTSMFGQPNNLTHRIYIYIVHTRARRSRAAQYPEHVPSQRIWPALIRQPCFHSVPLLRIPTIVTRHQTYPEIGYIRLFAMRDQYVRNTYNRIVRGIVSVRDRFRLTYRVARLIRWMLANSRDSALVKEELIRDNRVFFFLQMPI